MGNGLLSGLGINIATINFEGNLDACLDADGNLDLGMLFSHLYFRVDGSLSGLGLNVDANGRCSLFDLFARLDLDFGSIHIDDGLNAGGIVAGGVGLFGDILGALGNLVGDVVGGFLGG